MKNCWTLLLLAALLQSFIISVQSHHGGQNSGLAQILAAGLIVQLLAGRNQNGQQGRHSGAAVHAERSPYGNPAPTAYSPAPYEEEHRVMTPEATLSSSNWAQQAPLNIAYGQAQYKPPMMESYNMPYYNMPYPHYQHLHHALW